MWWSPPWIASHGHPLERGDLRLPETLACALWALCLADSARFRGSARQSPLEWSRRPTGSQVSCLFSLCRAPNQRELADHSARFMGQEEAQEEDERTDGRKTSPAATQEACHPCDGSLSIPPWKRLAQRSKSCSQRASVGGWSSPPRSSYRLRQRLAHRPMRCYAACARKGPVPSSLPNPLAMAQGSRRDDRECRVGVRVPRPPLASEQMGGGKASWCLSMSPDARRLVKAHALNR
jgi:hypothetical protein